MVLEGKRRVAYLGGELHNEKTKTSHLAANDQSLQTELQSITSAARVFENQLDIVKKPGSPELPERVSDALSNEDHDHYNG